jgi:anti-anti-sigma factor
MFTAGVEVRDGVGTILLAGELDHGTSDDLRRVVVAALSDGASSLVLDCSDLTFIDSMGLNVLLEANNAALDRSGEVTIRNPPDLLVRLMHVTRLDEAMVLQHDQDGHRRLDDLTEREADVLALVAKGLSNREIGEALFIGEQTVKSHLRTIFAKLGVTNRTQAARHAIGGGPGSPRPAE